MKQLLLGRGNRSLIAHYARVLEMAVDVRAIICERTRVQMPRVYMSREMAGQIKRSGQCWSRN